jgi:hypothetical protein
VRTADLAEILALAEVDPTIYEILGVRHEALCIVPEGQDWRVFLYERGNRHEERSFATEDEACLWFLKRVLTFSRGGQMRT